jgi:glycosyltransferase involved in cell wall biosynthesis
LKILLVHNRYRSSSPSGEDRVVDQECDALIAAGHEVRRFERFSDDIEGFSVTRKAIVPAEVVWSRSAARALRKALEQFEPDVVHMHNLFPLLSPSVLPACQSAHVPVVVTIHNYRHVCPSGDLFRSGQICRDCVGRVPVPSVIHGCYRGSSLATLPLAVANVTQRRVWRTVPSAYIFISASERDELRSLKWPDSRCFVKPNLVPPPAQTDKALEALVVYVGRVNESKGLRLLMRAWDMFERSGPHPSLRLAIAGSGPLEGEVNTWASGKRSVDVLGLLSREQCAKVLSRARAAIIPSEWLETFGLVVVEAMAAGVAPVATAHGSFPELITDGVDGVLFPPGDPAALAGVLERVAQCPDVFAELGKTARQSYEQRFDPEWNLEKLEAIYRFAIQHPSWLGPGDVVDDADPDLIG